MTAVRLEWIVALSVLAACTRDPTPQADDDGTGTTAGTTDGAPTPATTATSADSTQGDADATSDSGSTSASASDDTTTMATTGGSACGQIDLLFVIDNSGSMVDEQTRLLTAFPVFVSQLAAQLPGSDLHVMVTDVDGWMFSLCEDPGSHCDPPPECTNPDGTCNAANAGCLLTCTLQGPCEMAGHTCDGLGQEACDEVLGAGVDQTWGMDSSNRDCQFASGARFIDSSEPDLLSAFECAAQVGTSSFAATERPMESMVQALTAGTEAFACNEGFLRDDALLVVTFITDEDDDLMDSAGSPASWHTAVLDAKGGDPDDVVVLGMFGDGDLPGAICLPDPVDGGAEPSVRLRTFIDLWGARGIFGSVCAFDYGPFFSETAEVIDSACAAR